MYVYAYTSIDEGALREHYVCSIYKNHQSTKAKRRRSFRPGHKMQPFEVRNVALISASSTQYSGCIPINILVSGARTTCFFEVSGCVWVCAHIPYWHVHEYLQARDMGSKESGGGRKGGVQRGVCVVYDEEGQDTERRDV